MNLLYNQAHQHLYIVTFAIALIVSLLLTPLCRWLAIRFNIIDNPHSDIKTHRIPTPYLGGLAIWSGWALSLFLARYFTHFPTGTLRNLRGVLIGSVIMLALGLVDDILPKGLGYRKKFTIQILAAASLLLFDIRIQFINPYFIAAAFTIVWVVGITNAFNIVDIMDGLSGGLALIASLAFLFISLPTEQIYVNFCTLALAGGVLGFLPYNFSKKRKIFMGDTGSLVIGFILASQSLGTSYTKMNDFGVFAPLLILAIPIYDTFLVMWMRWKRGQSPFLGSRDHFALRLEVMGFTRQQILAITYTISVLLACGAYLVTRLSLPWASGPFLFSFLLALLAAYWISQVKVD